MIYICRYCVFTLWDTHVDVNQRGAIYFASGSLPHAGKIKQEKSKFKQALKGREVKLRPNFRLK